MPEQKQVTITLSEEEVELFKKFRHYQEPIAAIIDSGTFEMKNGSVTLNFNSEGLLSEIEARRKVYKRGKM